MNLNYINLDYINLNHIILGIIIFVLILDIRCDFLRKKFDFLPEKGGHRFFLYFIYLFPLIITSFSPGYNKECSIFSLIKGQKEFNIFNSIKDNMSFYATALTITFAVYSFLETQKATEKDRKEREDQEKKKQEERENRDFELREKELESEKDFYRPIFVVEEVENSILKVKLLMKNKDLYLENVQVWNQNGDFESCKNLKHNQEIPANFEKIFFITGQTLLGETILFTCINNINIKIYKYLKSNTSNATSNSDNFNKYWGSFNTYSKYDNSAWNHFISQKTTKIRNYLFNKNNILFFKNSLESKSIDSFFKIYFTDIKNEIDVNNKNINKYFKITKKLIEYLHRNIDIFDVNIDKSQYLLDCLYTYDRWGSEKSLNNITLEVNVACVEKKKDKCKEEILNFMIEYLNICTKNNSTHPGYHIEKFYEAFTNMFNFIEFSKENKDKINEIQFILIEAYTIEADK